MWWLDKSIGHRRKLHLSIPNRKGTYFVNDLSRVDVVDADFGGHHQDVVLGDVEAGRPQSVAD